ncbi:ATP-binding protein [Brucella endophytica]|uniref:ATP-binding protein n=1 Tax=Brucella endophytica TaxID=1963359 RepID=UPI003570FFE5
MLAARNLLENAVLHSPPDRSVACWLRREPGFLAVVIDDCGPDIPDDELPKVRDRFFRGATRRK